MVRTKPSGADLEEHLTEHVGFLITSAREYDGGNEAEAKRLAATIRALVHHTKKSSALLAQLGLIAPYSKAGGDLRFLDTSPPPSPPWTKFLADARLCSLVSTLRDGFSNASWTPKLDATHGGGIHGPISFNSWWKRSLVIVTQYGEEFTRERLILAIAHEDGGVHVDAKGRRADYERLTRKGAMGLQRTETGLFVGVPSGDLEALPAGDPDLNPGPASTRQIAHEMLRTLAGPRAELVAGYAPSPYRGGEGDTAGTVTFREY